MRCIDNPDLSAEELTTLRNAVNEWRTSQNIPCRPRAMGVYPSVVAARHIADTFPNLEPDLGRLISSRNLCLAFFAFLMLDWIGSDESARYRDRVHGRRFPVLDGCFVVSRSLDDALDAAKLHFKLYSNDPA